MVGRHPAGRAVVVTSATHSISLHMTGVLFDRCIVLTYVFLLSCIRLPVHVAGTCNGVADVEACYASLWLLFPFFWECVSCESLSVIRGFMCSCGFFFATSKHKSEAGTRGKGAWSGQVHSQDGNLQCFECIGAMNVQQVAPSRQSPLGRPTLMGPIGNL
jgi:hypothetical protein